jgi:protein-tyrosine phosphatase
VALGRVERIQVLFVCTGNICRSPMAEAMLRHRLELAGRDREVTVRSAGVLDSGRPAAWQAMDALAPRRLSLDEHRSTRLTSHLLADVDLVLGMAREHVRAVVVAEPAAWPRTFTLKELVRRGEEVGPRSGGQELGEWLTKVGAGRTRSDLAGDAFEDDIPDPVGSDPEVFEALALELDDLLARLAILVWNLI